MRGVPASRRNGLFMHMREFIWPSMGFVAMCRWAMLKLLRQASHPHYVARGAALGVMVSFFPILGTHTLLIAVLGYLFSASFVAAMLTSMLANPWTLPFMWAGSHKVGAVLLGSRLHHGPPLHLDILHPSTFVQEVPDMLETVILPTMLGGFVIAIPLALLTYMVVFWRLRARRATQRV